MTYRALFFNILISIFLCIQSPLTAGMMPNMEDFEKELAEANKAIEEYISSLPPAEQEEFNKQVDEWSRMFENMNEQEFEQFLGEMFADDPSMMMEPNPFDVAQQEIPEPVVEVVLSEQDKKKAETALAIIKDLITQSNLFMVIVGSSSDLPSRINQWVAKGQIQNWQSEKQWSAFKLELEAFVQKLYRAEDQDPVTKKYKYLLELIADEALYNNIIQLDTELKILIPIVNIPEFGIQKLSDESKTAIKDILTKYAESFYLLNIPQSLDELFLKYAPEEEKIRLAEEAATKKATETARTPRTPAERTEAGAEEMGYGYGDYGYGGYGDYGNYGYGGYGDYGYDNYDNYGNYGGYDNYGAESGAKTSGGKSSGGGGGSTGGGSVGRNELEDEEKEKKEEKEGKEKKGKKVREKFVPNYDLESAIADMKSNFKHIEDAMKDEEGKPTKLATLDTSIQEDADNVDIIFAGGTLPNIEKFISAINEDLEKIIEKVDKKPLKADELTHYQKEISKFFDTHKKTLDDLRKSIDKFERITPEMKQQAALAGGNAEKRERIDVEDEKKVSPRAQWAYFGGEDSLMEENEADQEFKDKFTVRVSLFDIKDTIDKLFENKNKFLEKKGKVVAPKKEKASKDLDLDLEE